MVHLKADDGTRYWGGLVCARRNGINGGSWRDVTTGRGNPFMP